MKLLSMALLICVNFSVFAGILDFLKSCDEQWEITWASCEKTGKRCSSLYLENKPSCEPEDKYLESYPNGKAGYDSYQREREEAKESQRNDKGERIRNVRISNYEYKAANKVFGNTQFSHMTADSITFEATVWNNLDITLENIALFCDITANNTVQLFKGRAHIYPNFISKSRGVSKIYFFPTESKASYAIERVLSDKNYSYIPIINLVGGIRSIEAKCNIIDVNPKSKSGYDADLMFRMDPEFWKNRWK
jgi:hypothetical protein